MKPAEQCIVCLGLKRVRLPLHQPLLLCMEDGPPVEMTIDNRPTYREYPCPECSDMVALQRVQAIVAVAEYPNHVPEEALAHVRRNIARGMVDRLISDGFIKIEQARDFGRVHIRATLGATPVEAVDNLEERIAARQEEVAREVIEEAVHEINSLTMAKENAYRMIRGALWSALERRKKWERK